MLHPYFEEFVGWLNEKRVRYLIVGAHAVAYHAKPRFTKDVDVLIDRSPENARRAHAAIREFFGGRVDFSPDELTRSDRLLQLGRAPVRIDVLTSIAGVPDFDAAWSRRADSRFGSQAASYISLEDLIAAKTASGRPQDRIDLRALLKAKELKTPSRPEKPRRKSTPKARKRRG